MIESLQLTDYVDYLIIAVLVFSMYFIVLCVFLTTHVTVCICHTEMKGYLLTYLLSVISEIVADIVTKFAEFTDEDSVHISCKFY